MEVIEKLRAIQSELKAPKNQFNSFGKYNYRSCEDILEAVKPLCVKHGLTLFLRDTVMEVAGIPFVEARAIVTDGTKSVECSAQAGIDINKKGMDSAQCFGSSSSYARKYALNGLFLIDDTKDSDATNTHGKEPQKEPEKPIIQIGSTSWKKAIELNADVMTVEKKYRFENQAAKEQYLKEIIQKNE